MKTRILVLIGAALLAAAPVLTAQDYVATPVQVSSEKVRLNGKIYLSHPVLERQTLYGIAKAYGVSVDDLYEANPNLREKGLQKDSILLIPTETGQKEGTSPAASSTSSSTGGFWEHTVKWYEGLSDIAAVYGVSEEEIMKANGLTSRKVTKRQVLRIPAKGSSVHRQATGGIASVPTVPAGSNVPSPTPKETAAPEVPVLSDPVISDPVVAEAGTYKPIQVDPLKVNPAEALSRKEEVETTGCAIYQPNQLIIFAKPIFGNRMKTVG